MDFKAGDRVVFNKDYLMNISSIRFKNGKGKMNNFFKNNYNKVLKNH